ncbi:MAG: Nif3-like dinuclear metal center hexameric protein [Niameybacter sp.]
MYALKDIMAHLETLAPTRLAEKWDHVGLMIGGRSTEIEKVLCALDLNLEVVEEAIEKGAQLIVTHHPCFFKPIASIDYDTPIGLMIQKLIQNNIAVYAMHTNLDIAQGGINDYLADRLGLQHVGPLTITEHTPLQKLVIYVPVSHYEGVREVLVAANTCTIGNYIGCTFGTVGKGTFIPLEGSNPYVGTAHTLEEVEEVKIECMIHPQDLGTIIEAVQQVHPYEEVAYDVFQLENVSRSEGLGRVGVCESISVEALIVKLKEVFEIPYVRLIGKADRQVSKVALCSGSGASFIGTAAACAEVYITGDVTFHEAQAAISQGITVIDVGHYPSENIAMPLIQTYLTTQCQMLEVICSTVDGETFKTV